MIRFNVVFLQSLFTMFIALGILGFLIAIIGKLIIVHSKLQSVIFLLGILSVNVYMVFYGKKYIEIESELSAIWTKNKSKNGFVLFKLVIFSYLCSEFLV